jgi:threonine dehydratase
VDDRDAMARGIAEAEGRVLVPPFDAGAVIAGQGTVGLEIAEDMAALGLALDAVMVPTGGGGLAAGIGLGLGEGPAVYAVEPAGFDDHARSLAAGARQTNPKATGSICDALLVPAPGELTFALNRRRLAGALTVTDAEAAAAVVRVFEELKLVVEPSGAVGLAAIMAGRLPAGAGAVVVVLSGGNVDGAAYATLLTGGAATG